MGMIVVWWQMALVMLQPTCFVGAAVCVASLPLYTLINNNDKSNNDNDDEDNDVYL